MKFRLLLLCALSAALALPATAAAHPSNATNSFAYGLGRIGLAHELGRDRRRGRAVHHDEQHDLEELHAA